MSRLAAELEDLGGADIAKALEELRVRSFVVDRVGVIRWASASTIDDLGDIVGRRWPELFSDYEAQRIGTSVERVLRDGVPAEISFEVEERDFVVRRREMSIAPLRDGTAVLGIFGVTAAATAERGPMPAAGSADLTKRQLEILQLLADGKSTSEIADELFLSKTTVRNHVAHLLANLGAHTRVQAIVAASRAGLLRLEPDGDGDDESS